MFRKVECSGNEYICLIRHTAINIISIGEQCTCLSGGPVRSQLQYEKTTHNIIISSYLPPYLFVRDTTVNFLVPCHAALGEDKKENMTNIGSTR